MSKEQRVLVKYINCGLRISTSNKKLIELRNVEDMEDVFYMSVNRTLSLFGIYSLEHKANELNTYYPKSLLFVKPGREILTTTALAIYKQQHIKAEMFFEAKRLEAANKRLEAKYKYDLGDYTINELKDMLGGMTGKEVDALRAMVIRRLW